MSDYRKNFIVGLTMLLGLVLLGVMIWLFGKAPAKLLSANRLAVTFEANRADGLSEGSLVHYLGVDAGTIESVARDPLNNTRVFIKTLLYPAPTLPGNLVGKIVPQFVGGGAQFNLEFEGDQPVGKLDPKKLYHADFISESLVPPEFVQLASELRLLTETFRHERIVENTNQLVLEIDADAKRLGKLMDMVNQTLGDPKTKEDFMASLSNIRQTTDHAIKISENLEKVSSDLDKKISDVSVQATLTLKSAQGDLDQTTHKLNDRLEQTAKLLETFQSIALKIDKGDGTAGMLVNDPKLYQSMAATMQELKSTVADLKLLIDQWTQEGIHIH